jgi:ribonuclease BN (tRNA processing enzyme)
MFLLWWALENRTGKRTPPVVLAGKTTWGHLRALWEHSYSELPAPAYTEVELADEGSAARDLAPNVTLATWPMVHSAQFPVLGARLQIDNTVLAFTADTARCENVVVMARGADLLVHDARYALTVPPERLDQSAYHCSASDAGGYAQAAGVKSLALVHVGAEYEGRHEGLVAEAKAKFSKHVFAPRAGDVVRV